MHVMVVAKLIFMMLTNQKNELETKHSYHAFLMQMCMMNIFVVFFSMCILQQADSTCRSVHKLVHDAVP